MFWLSHFLSLAELRDKIGLCQWFQFGDKQLLEATINDLAKLGIHNLRTGLSWADYHRPGGEQWYDYQMGRLAEANLNVLLSVWHTPPSISESGSCSGPPRRLLDYADFISKIIDRYTGKFEALELWNEPNNRLKWNFADYDPDWAKFSEMVGAAAYWAKRCGQRTVLGGMMPVDKHWLKMLANRGVLDVVDVVAIHSFPGMWTGDRYWWDWPRDWHGWPARIQDIQSCTASHPIWVTETGFATCQENSGLPNGHEQQCKWLFNAIFAPAERLYWYCVRDMSYRHPCIEMTEDGGRIDHREYHLGLTTAAGKRKPAWQLLWRLMHDGLEEAVSYNRASGARKRL
jgi:CDP-paratose 2-epimerase